MRTAKAIMHTEIERKFLVANEGWRSAIVGSQKLRDGLLARLGDGNVRVRLSQDAAWITLKGPRVGLRRAEFEYEIPRDEAEAMLRTFCTGPLVEKTRYYVADGPLIWMVDVHEGDLAGIVFAEIELDCESQPLPLPAWIGREVTGDPLYRKRVLFERGEGVAALVRDLAQERRPALT
jgi:adenylate cyclase